MSRSSKAHENWSIPSIYSPGVVWVGGVLIAIVACVSLVHFWPKSPQNPVVIEAPVALLPPPTSTPKPTPTPDPYIAAQKIPLWAQGKVLREVPVKPGDKVIALTFDDGPWPQHTQQILSILARHGVKATFYMVGQVVQEYPKIAQQVRAAGHSIGSHSWSHPMRPRDARAQIDRTDAIIKKTVGVTPTTYRPPYGALKNGMDKRAMQLHKSVVLWTADSDDWKRPAASRMVAKVLREASPGGIILMHDGGGPRSHTVQALAPIITGLKNRGYRFVTVPELLRLRYIAPRPTATPRPSPKPKTPARS